ncbi:glycerol-3-phosphate dehydrogenase [Alteraurantiacibacter aquimixticola]|uniref:Glycerol-3-phosphate dehydrogenase n=1 Tax=Alteraurantiacibacter aquimixticola TaxID=2489173 RepID=A0A4T3F2S4_9SPHN|nr:glycerol-3-phosphate dehydrogenase [Alteraurantiacibacter aquimixticola]TIX49725.1 glycerol-3-phosphate dehydrogenase [Alteraurantiacibacter aquimixticola]
MTASSPYDLIVIGGGVNGAGVARDAAGRGAKVLLLEAHDLASGTSSKSTKLVHGGLRYLEYMEFGLVREALGERETLWEIAPHIVRPMRFVLPVNKAMRAHWKLRAGLFLYDHIGGKGTLPGSDAIDLDEHPAGRALKGECSGGFEYSDGWVDDARLVVLNARDATRHGAEVLTRTKVTSLSREGDLWNVRAGRKTFKGKAVVNAAGPAVDDLAKLAGLTPKYGIRRVRGSHIVVPRLFQHDFAYILQQPDTRICFAIPYEDDYTLIGTTDAEHPGSLDSVEPDEDEVRYLCDAVNRYFTKNVTPDDVVWSYAGVRALVDFGADRPEAATRGYRLVLSDEEDGAPFLGIYGGKITSYRHVAEEVVDMLAKRMPDVLTGKRWTAKEHLPGGDFPRDAQGLLVGELLKEYPFLSKRDATRIARAYGLDAIGWLDDAKSWEDLGRNFGAGLSEAEVNYLREQEWAVTAEDVLWRRSKLGLHLIELEEAALAAFMGG